MDSLDLGTISISQEPPSEISRRLRFALTQIQYIWYQKNANFSSFIWEFFTQYQSIEIKKLPKFWEFLKKYGLSYELQEASNLIALLIIKRRLLFCRTFDRTKKLFVCCLTHSTSDGRNLLNNLTNRSLIFDHLYNSSNLSFDTF